MAKTRRSTAVSGQKAAGHSSGTLKTILILTLLVLAAALGLMIWNSYQARNAEELSLLQRDALLAGERFNQKAERATDRLENELRSGLRVSSISPDYIGMDTVSSLNVAMQSSDEALARAAEKAAELTADGKRLALLEDGRLVLSHVPTVGNTVLATVEVKKWLSAPDDGARLLLYGDAVASAGNAEVLPPGNRILRRGMGFRSEGVMERSATACVDIGGASLSLCVSRNSPWLTVESGLALLLNLLLIAAPGLAITGLYRHTTRSENNTARASAPGDGRLELAASNAAVGAWDIRRADGSAWINEETARLLGWAEPGETTEEAFIGAFASSHHAIMREALGKTASGAPFSVHAPTRVSGGETWLDLRGNHIQAPDDDTFIVSGVIFDVTQTVRMQERRRTAEAKLRSAIESFPCPFALWDKNKRLFFWNHAYETLFDLSSVLRPGVRHETVAVARSAKVISEQTVHDTQGSTLLGLRNNQWIKMVEQTTSAGTLISFGIDVTNDVRTEEQLMNQKKKLKSLVQELERSEGHKAELARKYNEEKSRAERSADSKSAFLANMSHELRTPLNAINGFSEILVNEMYGPLGDKRYGEYAKDILTSGQHLLDMINDILDIAKIEAGKMTIDPKPIDLVDPVDAAVRMIRRKAEDKGVQVSIQAEEGLPHIDADHRAVRQMVLNLLSNAIKFTDAGGRITVGVQRRDGFMRIAVRDTGVGIPKEHLPRLAKPFEQVHETRERNYEGTGLGLALTKSFAEMHGGKLTLASEEGKGTMVCIYLPVTATSDQSGRNVA